MKGLKPAILIAKISLSRIFQSKTPYILFLTGILFSILATWDAQKQQIEVLSIALDSAIINSDRVGSMKRYYYNFYSFVWVLLFLGYIPKKVLLPLSNSFSVSQTLWLRLSPASSFDLALSRFLVILCTTVFLIILSLIWAITHSLLQDVRIIHLLLPVFGLTGHLLMSCGIVIFFGKSHKIVWNSRMVLVVMAILIPPLLYSFNDRIISYFYGFFPFASPFVVEEIGILAFHPFLAAIFTGLLLLIFYLFPIFIREKNTNF